MPTEQQINTGLFVPTTNVWDVAELQQIEVTSPAFKDLLIRLYQNINAISLSLNMKDSGLYVEEEFVNGQTYPATSASSNSFALVPRQVYRKIIDFGALPNTGTKSVAHNIDVLASYEFVRIYGTASDQVALTYLPLPYSDPSALSNAISLSVSSTNVTVVTGANYSAYTNTWIVLEFLKS